jgi:hypothetical protein
VIFSGGMAVMVEMQNNLATRGAPTTYTAERTEGISFARGSSASP